MRKLRKPPWKSVQELEKMHDSRLNAHAEPHAGQPKFGTNIPYLMLGFLHGFWHTFGAKGPYLMLGSCAMLGTSLASYLMSGLLHCCCYTSGSQDKLLISLSVIQLLHAFFCLENDLHLKARNATHTHTKLHLHYTQQIFSGFISCAQL